MGAAATTARTSALVTPASETSHPRRRSTSTAADETLSGFRNVKGGDGCLKHIKITALHCCNTAPHTHTHTQDGAGKRDQGLRSSVEGQQGEAQRW